MKKIFVVLLCLALCGCGTEPEARSFVTAAAVERDNTLWVLTARGSIENEENEKNHRIIGARGETLAEAAERCGDKSGGELFFGHTSVCIVERELLKDRQAVEELAEFMEKNTQISRRVVLLAADNPREVLDTQAEGKTVADFVKGYYKSHKELKSVELNELCIALAEGEESELRLPVAVCGGEDIEISQ